MLFYNLSFLAYSCCLFVFQRATLSSFKFHIILAFPLILFAGMRGYIGSDYNEYLRIFDLINLTPSLHGLLSDLRIQELHVEAGYAIYAWLVLQIIPHGQVVIFLTAALSIVLIMSTFAKVSKYWILPFILYLSHDFVLKDLIQIRAGLVAAIFCFSLLFYEKNKVVFVTLNIIATGFNLGAFAAVFFPIFYFLTKHSKLKWFWVLPILLLSQFGVFGIFLTTLSEYASHIHWKASLYLSAPQPANLFFDLQLLKKLFIYFSVLMIMRVDKIECSYWLNVCIACLNASIFLRIFLSNYPIVAGRMSSLYNFSDYFLIVFVVMSTLNSQTCSKKAFLICLLIALAQLNFHLLINDRLLPYTTFI